MPPRRTPEPASTAAPGEGGVAIRAASPADRADIFALEQRAFAFDRISRRAFGHLLARANAAVLAALADETVCGCAVVLFRRGSARARLYSIAVAPECRRQGIGAALLAAAEAAARARGTCSLRLEVRADAPTVQAFYRRYGFRAGAIRAGYYQDGADAVCMEKALPPRTAAVAADAISQPHPSVGERS
jgi:ribosomal protein S18 acetylase RimI-like enzyme